jgi:hypothetical protein
MKICPKCGGQNPDHAANCVSCTAPFTDSPFGEKGDATGGVIPYKNPQALIAYYLGIVSGLPIIGLPFGIASFVLGIQGLRARRRNPAIKGSIHAGIGIGCGCFFSMLWTLVIVTMVIAMVQQK